MLDARLETDLEHFRAVAASCLRGLVDRSDAVRLLEEAQADEERCLRETGDAAAVNMDMADRLPSYWDCVGPLAEVPPVSAGERIATAETFPLLWSDHAGR